MELKNMISEERYKRMEWVLSQRTKYFSLILENLYDPHNISAILRTAEAYGLQDVHIVDDKNPFRVSESISMGADRWLNIKQHKSTLECIKNLKNNGYQIYTADPDPNNPTIEELPLDNPFAVIMGQEKWGVSEEAMSYSDKNFRIPLYGFVESFNVSVASAVLVSQFSYVLRGKNMPADFYLSEQEKEDLMKHWSLKNNFKGPIRKYLE